MWNSFPGGANDTMRHCVASCVAAKRYGVGWARLAGFANELQGLWIDIINLQEGAFQLSDLKHNEWGFALAQVSADEFGCWTGCKKKLGGSP